MAISNKQRTAVKSYAKANPKVDLKSVTEALETVGELRRRGIAGPKYDLASPYGRSVRHSSSEGSWAEARK